MKKLFFLSVLLVSSGAYAQRSHTHLSAAMPAPKKSTLRIKHNPRKDTADGQDTVSPCKHRFGVGLYVHDPKLSVSLRFTRRLFIEYRVGVENVFAGPQHPAPFNDLGVFGLYYCGHIVRVAAGTGINTVIHERLEEGKRFEWYWNMVPVHAELFPWPRFGFTFEAGAIMPIGYNAKPSMLLDGGLVYYFN